MPKVNLTPALRTEYENLFNTSIIRPEKLAEIESYINGLVAHSSRYQSVGDPLGIPWHFIAVIHNMEASQRFTKHLHNGDPLNNRTVHEPPGRPKGTPPFTWEESATDALTMRGLGKVTDWSLAGTLYQLEGYNGWGYRLYHQHVLSSYLWSYSNHYRSGKYVADGTWSDTAVSQQCGAAVLLRRMAENNQISFADQPAPPSDSAPLVVAYTMTKPDDPAVVAKSEALQSWLNTFPGIFVKVDGVPGERTSNAYKSVTGGYLPGDPRG
jgi:lysozyme family protein